MSDIKKNTIIQTIKRILFYAVIVFLGLFIFFEIVAPKQTVKVFGFKPYYVLTPSMEPVLKVNDLIIVKNADVETLEVGDIITFLADIDYNGESEIVTHYINSITEDTPGEYIIRTNRYYAEDQEIVQDPWVLTNDDVLGEYSFRVPLLGLVAQFLQSPFGIAAVVVNAGIIVAIVILIKRDKQTQAKAIKEENGDSE